MAEDKLSKMVGNIVDEFVDGLTYLGKLEYDVLDNAGKVTTIVNGQVVREERFGRVTYQRGEDRER